MCLFSIKKYTCSGLVAVGLACLLLVLLACTREKGCMLVLREFRHNSSVIRTVAFSPDGRYALSVGADGTRLWDVKTGKELRFFEDGTSAAFSPDGKFIVTGRATESLRLYEITTGKEIRRFEPHEGVGKCVAFSPDGRYLLSGGGPPIEDNKIVPGGFLRLWDVQTGKEIRHYEGFKKLVRKVVFTPDSKYAIAASTEYNRCLWEIETGKVLRHPSDTEGLDTTPIALAISPDGKHFLSGLALCNMETGKIVREYKRSSKGSTSDTHTNNIAFSPDGKRFVSGDDDGLVRLWDVESGKEICHVFGLKTEGKILSVAFSPDGRSVLASGDSWIGFESLRRGLPGSDPYVRLWSVPE